ncbi:hypothetical protein [Antiquaquibacter soli]|uniref:Cytoplasmic membrane protein n=1 Tax=Antiquaquibacter soli TaxID=3064523 RepID=A0ABT9BQ49_9MICO|nr:hypothetical protein [Protaetiibacter sp. WY-16]MDO7882547.1 hypothetical protein [Protaetiibacter sp. WY-16]
MSSLGWIRAWIVFFMVALVVSGVTAFPLLEELTLGSSILHSWGVEQWMPALVEWIDRVRAGLADTYASYPWLAYGTDWLAFAHLVIAVAFVGPLGDPVRNVWVIHWGMIACVGVIPLALIAGSIRGLPWGWMLVDMSFGVFGIIPLLIILRLTRRIEHEQAIPTSESPERPV